MEKNYSGFYHDIHIYEVAKVIDTGNDYRVEYITQSTLPWSSGDDGLLPLHPNAADLIRDAQRNGKEPYIQKNWNEISNEVLITSVFINPISDLLAYKRRAYSFIKAFINPMMASAHASVIYGFTTLNNKFLLNGFVFNEKTKSMQYIKILDKAEELEDTNPELSEELMADLQKYIDFKEILSRTNFIWVESEKYIDKIEKVSPNKFESEQEAKEEVDKITLEFTTKIRTLNNLK